MIFDFCFSLRKQGTTVLNINTYLTPPQQEQEQQQHF